jgi:hypothetical protein
MPQLTDVQKKIPSAHTIAGRVIAYHNGKHYDLGQYMGEGLVMLSTDGEQLMAPPKEAGIKRGVKKVDTILDDLEV